jgi:hypothetical protein
MHHHSEFKSQDSESSSSLRYDDFFNNLLEPVPGKRSRLGFPRDQKSDSSCVLGRRPAAMARAYSLDLRERVVAAIEEGL